MASRTRRTAALAALPDEDEFTGEHTDGTDVADDAQTQEQADMNAEIAQDWETDEDGNPINPDADDDDDDEDADEDDEDADNVIDLSMFTKVSVAPGLSIPPAVVAILERSERERNGKVYSWYECAETQFGKDTDATVRVLRQAAGQLGIGLRVRNVDGLVKFAAAVKRRTNK